MGFSLGRMSRPDLFNTDALQRAEQAAVVALVRRRAGRGRGGGGVAQNACWVIGFEGVRVVGVVGDPGGTISDMPDVRTLVAPRPLASASLYYSTASPPQQRGAVRQPAVPRPLRIAGDRRQRLVMAALPGRLGHS